MTLIVTRAVLASYWLCDGCAVESLPRVPSDPLPFGWAWEDHGEDARHFCPECRLVFGVEAGYGSEEGERD